ncbi:MAG: DNA recombination protein RmuC, partial [Opitutales bacterium]
MPSSSALPWSEIALFASMGFVLGALVFGLVGLLASRRASARAVAEADSRWERETGWLREQKAAAEERAEQLRRDLTEQAQATNEARIELAQLRVSQEKDAAAAAEKIALLKETEQRLREEFKVLANEALTSSNRGFLELAQQNFATLQQQARGDLEQRKAAVEGLVKPIREQLSAVYKELGELEAKREGAYQGLSEQVKSLLATGQQLQRETGQLVQALRAPQVRGRWGELQLRRAVELAGMLERCDFFEQVHAEAKDDQARVQRPDMIVRLPNERSLVVDAKAPLAAYLDALEAPLEERAQHYARHARQLRDHVKSLRQKAYWEQFDDAPDFVVLFIPGEVFFAAALEADSALLDDAVSEKVIIASPTTLIALLKAVAYGWQQAAVEREARHVVWAAQQLYDRLTTVLGTHLGKMRSGLDSAVKAYNSAVGSIESRVLPAARRLRDFESLPLDPLPEVKPAEETALKEPSAAELLEA